MISKQVLWPFDEVELSVSTTIGLFDIKTPWISFQVEIEENQRPRVSALSRKMKDGTLSVHDLDEVNWFFSSLTKYPLAYILPRTYKFGSDQHSMMVEMLDLQNPRTFFESLCFQFPRDPNDLAKRNKFTTNCLNVDWSWDIEAALAFSKVEDGYDPITLFSIARRYHLLNDVQNNKTRDLFIFLTENKENEKVFNFSASLVARQNHFITQRCDQVLRSALPISQSSYDEILDFIEEESGHDRIIEKALQSMGNERAEAVPTVDTVHVLMDTFEMTARRNLLGFSMVTDIFERSTFTEEDPFAEILKSGGAIEAARLIDVHRKINDEGEHENLAVGFISPMKPVGRDYAEEALRLSELATIVIHNLSRETLEHIKKHLNR